MITADTEGRPAFWGRLLKEFPDQKIVMLSGYDLSGYRREPKRLGAMGFLNKNMEPDELVKALTQIQEGRTRFPRSSLLWKI